MDVLGLKIAEVGAGINQLLSKITLLQTENRDLRTKLEALENQNHLNLSKMKEMEEEIELLIIAKRINNDQETTEIKEKIDELVREIDQCISLLSET
ncbi:MAG TPA: hypothetical protein PKE52_03330 [Bacteroidales bacterium]|jgi:predicted RNase H-like nuclease (RuvC/YqgF family)|nr:hypothetical protein [Bacteroidales bacterium]